MAALRCDYVDGEWVETGCGFANINAVNCTKVWDVSEAVQSTVARPGPLIPPSPSWTLSRLLQPYCPSRLPV
jgi:hypothetical protein